MDILFICIFPAKMSLLANFGNTAVSLCVMRYIFFRNIASIWWNSRSCANFRDVFTVWKCTLVCSSHLLPFFLLKPFWHILCDNPWGRATSYSQNTLWVIVVWPADSIVQPQVCWHLFKHAFIGNFGDFLTWRQICALRVCAFCLPDNFYPETLKPALRQFA